MADPIEHTGIVYLGKEDLPLSIIVTDERAEAVGKHMMNQGYIEPDEWAGRRTVGRLVLFESVRVFSDEDKAGIVAIAEHMTMDVYRYDYSLKETLFNDREQLLYQLAKQTLQP